MRILLAGGVYRLPADARGKLRPAPEQVLEAGLRLAGEDVHAVSLKDFKAGLLSSRYDIVHVHHMSKMAVLQALLPQRMVFTPHSSTYGQEFVRRTAEWIVWHRSDGIVCLSENEKHDKIAHFPNLAGKIAVIPNGIPPLAHRSAVALRTWRRDEPFVMAAVGQLIELKRLDLAIRALKTLPPNVRLHLTYHNDRLESELKTLARDIGVFDRVHFLGQASGEELHRRYQEAHVLLLTSYTEALPSVVSEALITGCPVIASDVGGVREQVGPAGIIVDRDAATYATAVQAAMAGYEALATEALHRGRALRDEYSPEAMAQRHIELYRRILEDK